MSRAAGIFTDRSLRRTLVLYEAIAAFNSRTQLILTRCMNLVKHFDMDTEDAQ